MTLILDLKKIFKKILGGIYMSNKLQQLYTKRVDLKDMINRASMNGETQDRIEILEMELINVDRKIDQENLKLYGGGALHA